MHMPQKGFRQHTYEVPGLESEDPFAYGLQTRYFWRENTVPAKALTLAHMLSQHSGQITITQLHAV